MNTWPDGIQLNNLCEINIAKTRCATEHVTKHSMMPVTTVMTHNMQRIPASLCIYWLLFKIVTSLILPAVFAALIQPICLPLSPDIRSRDFVRHYPFIAGWGSIHFSECQDRDTK